MQSLPRISIVVPSYNQGEFIEATLRSLVEQDYPNLEIIVVDGGSKDGTVDVLRQYERFLKSWVSEPDKGQTDALIKGFQSATGDILGWLCSDDQLLPGCLRLVAQEFVRTPNLDFVYGDTEYLYPNGDRVLKPRISYHYNTMLRAFNIIAQPSCFFSAQIYSRVGGLDATLQYAMDYDLFLRFGPNVRWKQLKQSLSLYRIHPSSKTVNDLDKFEKEWWRCREKITGAPRSAHGQFLWLAYTARVVLMFFLQRGLIKIRYDKRKYVAA